jgi:O-antigen/teichoic acid export membrane protein
MSDWRTSVKEALVKLQAYTHTDNIYLAKNLFYVGGSQLFAILNGFVIYILVARFVDPSVYGEYKYLVALFEMSAICCLTGAKVAIVRSVANGSEGTLRFGYRTRLRYGYLLGVPLLGGSLWYAFHGNVALAVACGAMYVFSPVYNASTLAFPFLQAKKQFKRLGLFTILTELSLFFGMLSAIFFAKSALAFFVIFLLVNATYIIYYLLAVKTTVNTQMDASFLPHAKHQSWLDMLTTIASRIDSALVFYFLGATDVAKYAFALLTVDQLKVIGSSIYTVAGPKMAANPLQVTLKTFRRKMVLLGAIGFVATVVYFFAAPWMYRIFFPAYVSVVDYSRVYMLSLICVLPTTMGGYLLNLKGLRKETTTFNIVNSLILLTLLVCGGWKFGVWGIIWARVIASALQLVSFVALLARIQRNLASISDQEVV